MPQSLDSLRNVMDQEIKRLDSLWETTSEIEKQDVKGIDQNAFTNVRDHLSTARDAMRTAYKELDTATTGVSSSSV